MWEVLAGAMRRRRSPAGPADDEESIQLVSTAKRGASQPGQPPQPPGQPPLASRADVAARCRPGLAFVVAAVFLLLPALQAYARPPAALWQAAGLAGLAYLCYRVVTFQRWGDELPYVWRFVACIGAMVVELLWENVMVWIVSALDQRKYEDVPGLQDNGEILFDWLATKGAVLSWFINGKWANFQHFLGCVLALAFSVAWDQHPYSGFGVMARFSLTVCLSRILRVACFMSTVLPNPRPGCYRRRFPPPPDTWQGMLAVGLKQLRGFGGCNDLVFSGHGAFWVMGPLVFRAYYPHPWAAPLLWLALGQTSIRDVIDQQHYSLDMLLAVVVTWAVWDWLAWVYPPERPLPRRPEGQPGDAPSGFVLSVVGFGLLTAFVCTFVAKS